VIEEQAFSMCTVLERVDIPNGVERLSSSPYAFVGCERLAVLADRVGFDCKSTSGDGFNM